MEILSDLPSINKRKAEKKNEFIINSGCSRTFLVLVTKYMNSSLASHNFGRFLLCLIVYTWEHDFFTSVRMTHWLKNGFYYTNSSSRQILNNHTLPSWRHPELHQWRHLPTKQVAARIWTKTKTDWGSLVAEMKNPRTPTRQRRNRNYCSLPMAFTTAGNEW